MAQTKKTKKITKKKSRILPSTKEIVVEMLNTGFTYKQITEALGISQASVSRIAAQLKKEKTPLDTSLPETSNKVGLGWVSNIYNNPVSVALAATSIGLTISAAINDQSLTLPKALVAIVHNLTALFLLDSILRSPHKE